MLSLERIGVRTCLAALALAIGVAGQAGADDRAFRLSAPAGLIDSGLLKFILPRFSLKTQVRIEIVPDGSDTEAAFGATGKPVFRGPDRLWHLAVDDPAHPGVAKFADWITSEAGRRAITGFRVGERQPFTLPASQAAVVAPVAFDGDAVAGKALSLTLCGRCHAVSAGNRMKTIGSTPSFFALRTLKDWARRFTMFYVLNPHPSFTQIDQVTPAFAEDRPPPIVPLAMSMADLEAIIAYVATLEPADLGAPVQHQ